MSNSAEFFNPDDGEGDLIRREVRAAYSGLASEYVQATSSFEHYPGLRGELEAFLCQVPSGVILDVGSGSGRDALLAAEMGRSVVRADASLEVLLEGGRLVSCCGSVCCDVTRLPFPDNSFAGLIASGVLLHLNDTDCRRALREILRILISNGLAVISMKAGEGQGWRTTPAFPSRRWFSYYSLDEFATMCRSAGLEIVAMSRSGRKDWFSLVVAKVRLATAYRH